MPKTKDLFRKVFSVGKFRSKKLLLPFGNHISICWNCFSGSTNNIWKQINVSCATPRTNRLSEEIIFNKFKLKTMFSYLRSQQTINEQFLAISKPSWNQNKNRRASVKTNLLFEKIVLPPSQFKIDNFVFLN